VTIIPTFIVRINAISDDTTKMILLFGRVFRVFSIYRLNKFFARRNMNLVRVYFRLIYTFFSIIIIFASLMLYVEN
jgi:hypothetical protein